MPAYAIFDEGDFPVVRVIFTGAAPTEENFAAYLSGLRSVYEEKEPFTFIFDATRAGVPAFRYQRMQADWLRAHDALIRTYCRGTAYVIPNPVIRTVLRAIFALQSQPVPYVVVGKEEEAREWAEGRC